VSEIVFCTASLFAASAIVVGPRRLLRQILRAFLSAAIRRLLWFM
jgi:hypothetical protein